MAIESEILFELMILNQDLTICTFALNLIGINKYNLMINSASMIESLFFYPIDKHAMTTYNKNTYIRNDYVRRCRLWIWKLT